MEHVHPSIHPSRHTAVLVDTGPQAQELMHFLSQSLAQSCPQTQEVSFDYVMDLHLDHLLKEWVRTWSRWSILIHALIYLLFIHMIRNTRLEPQVQPQSILSLNGTSGGYTWHLPSRVFGTTWLRSLYLVESTLAEKTIHNLEQEEWGLPQLYTHRLDTYKSLLIRVYMPMICSYTKPNLSMLFF